MKGTDLSPKEDIKSLALDSSKLSRMLGIANLHYLDPSDEIILNEFINLRRSLAKSIIQTEPTSFPKLWNKDLNDIYWVMVQSAIQNTSLTTQDQAIKNAAIERVGIEDGFDFKKIAFTKAFLVSLLYNEHKNIINRVKKHELPKWLTIDISNVTL